MNFPFVSRGRFDDAVERLRVRDTEYAELLYDFKALRLQGASIPDPVPTLPRSKPDPVMLAISKAAGSDSALRSMMTKAAMAARQMGAADDDIIQNIERGVPVDDGVPA